MDQEKYVLLGAGWGWAACQSMPSEIVFLLYIQSTLQRILNCSAPQKEHTKFLVVHLNMYYSWCLVFAGTTMTYPGSNKWPAVASILFFSWARKRFAHCCIKIKSLTNKRHVSIERPKRFTKTIWGWTALVCGLKLRYYLNGIQSIKA